MGCGCKPGMPCGCSLAAKNASGIQQKAYKPPNHLLKQPKVAVPILPKAAGKLPPFLPITELRNIGTGCSGMSIGAFGSPLVLGKPAGVKKPILIGPQGMDESDLLFAGNIGYGCACSERGCRPPNVCCPYIYGAGGLTKWLDGPFKGSVSKEECGKGFEELASPCQYYFKFRLTANILNPKICDYPQECPWVEAGFIQLAKYDVKIAYTIRGSGDPPGPSRMNKKFCSSFTLHLKYDWLFDTTVEDPAKTSFLDSEEPPTAIPPGELVTIVDRDCPGFPLIITSPEVDPRGFWQPARISGLSEFRTYVVIRCAGCPYPRAWYVIGCVGWRLCWAASAQDWVSKCENRIPITCDDWNVGGSYEWVDCELERGGCWPLERNPDGNPLPYRDLSAGSMTIGQMLWGFHGARILK